MQSEKASWTSEKSPACRDLPQNHAMHSLKHFWNNVIVLRSSLFAPSPLQDPQPPHPDNETLLEGANQRSFGHLKKHMPSPFAPRAWAGSAAFKCSAPKALSLFIRSRKAFLPGKTKKNARFVNKTPWSGWCIAYLRKGRAKWSQSFLGDGTVKTLPCGKKGETFGRSFPRCCCWKERCASALESPGAGARFFMAFCMCLKQNLALGMALGSVRQIPGRNNSIKTQMREKT